MLLRATKPIPKEPQEFEAYLQEKYIELRVVKPFSVIFQAVLMQDILTKEEKTLLGEVLSKLNMTSS